VCLTDILDDGLSLVYSFFDPAKADQSLGAHIILDHVELARAAGLPYVYLGYWVPGSPKMDYKARYSALEVYHGGAWQPIGTPDSYTSATHPLSVPPIAEQVTRLKMPGTMSSPVATASRLR
jgi:arginine-tRNA-protein transferase